MKNNLFFLFLLLWFSISVKAQWTNNTLLNTMVCDSIGTEESTPMSATRTDGSTYISYFEQYGSYYQLRMQLLDKFGNKLWAPGGLVVSSYPQSSALYRYDLTVDASDNAIVAFQDIRTSANLNVVVYKIDASGNFIWGNSGIQLIDPVSSEGMAPNLGITASNNVVVAWTATNGTAKWIAYQKISSNGSPMWTNVHRIIDSTFVKRFSRPTIVSLDMDDFVMLYAQETGSGLGLSVLYAQHIGINGSGVWAPALQVSTKSIPFFFFPKAVSDGNGGFYVTFNAAHAVYTSQTDVYVQHVSSIGTIWNATGNVACALTNTQHYAASSRFDATNNAFWILMKVTDVNQNLSGVYVQSMNGAGNALLGANAVEVAPVAAAYNDPRDFSITSDGVISIYSIGSSSLSQTLAAVKNTLAGVLAWSGNPVTICSAVAGKDDLSTGLFTNNQIVIVWDDNRNDYGVYAQIITNNGTLDTEVSVAENPTENTFEVYPNPSAGLINITMNDVLSNLDGIVNVEICNSFGQQVLAKDMDRQISAVIDLSGFAKGLYFVKLHASSRVEVRKVILE